MPLLALASVSAVVVAVACGGNEPTPQNPTGPTDSSSASAMPSASAAESATATSSASASASASAVPVPTVWSATMPKEQQMAFMQKNVMPKMGPIFKEHDPKKYADFSCKTCHGPEYKEPKAYLPHLTFKNGGFTQAKDKPEMTKWMMEKVSAPMADAMGLPHYDPKTNQGFGCGGCHTIDMK
jgi:hypothetical protein